MCERKGFVKERVRVFAPVSKIKRDMFTREYEREGGILSF